MARTHGLRSTYVWGCKCLECREAAKKYSKVHTTAYKEYNKSFLDENNISRHPKANHGTRSCYNNYGCKCLSCKLAESSYANSYKKKRRAMKKATND
jgi:hypothetical protein